MTAIQQINVTKWLNDLFDDKSTNSILSQRKKENDRSYYTWPEILQFINDKNGRVKIDGKWVDVKFKVVNDQLHVEYPILI